MALERFQRLPEEENRNLNQITDPVTARLLADIEKPIRDLARDPGTNPTLRTLKPLLDKEAERIADSADTEQRIKQELLHQPIDVIKLSAARATNAFYDAAMNLDLNTIEDLTHLSIGRLGAQKQLSTHIAHEVQAWLMERGLSLRKPFDGKK